MKKERTDVNIERKRTYVSLFVDDRGFTLCLILFSSEPSVIYQITDQGMEGI